MNDYQEEYYHDSGYTGVANDFWVTDIADTIYGEDDGPDPAIQQNIFYM